MTPPDRVRRPRWIGRAGSAARAVGPARFLPSHFPSLARVESKEQELRRDKAKYEKHNAIRPIGIVEFGSCWQDPDFALEHSKPRSGNPHCRLRAEPRRIREPVGFPRRQRTAG